MMSCLMKSNIKTKFISLTIGTAIAPASLLAQDQAIELETVVLQALEENYAEISNTTALKSSSDNNKVPYSVTSTNQALINDTNSDNLEDLVGYSTGLSSTGYDVDGFSIRGFDLDFNNVKTDGMSGVTTRFGSPSLANIERVEVLKGPASVLYGSMETGGMINLVTKTPEKEFSGSFTTTVQSYATDVSEFGEDVGATGTLDITGSLAGLDDVYYRLIMTAESIESFRDGVSNDEYYIYPSILWEIDDTSSLTLSLEAGAQNGDADYGLFAAQQDIDTVAPIDTVYQDEDDYDYDNDEGYAFNLDYEKKLDNGEYHFKWRSVLQKNERYLFENNRVNDVDLDAGEDIADTTLRRRLRHQYNELEWHSFDTYLEKDYAIGSVNHAVTFGISGEYRLTDYDRVIYGGFADEDVSIYDPDTDGTAEELEGNHRLTEYYSAAIYAQDNMTINDRLNIVASARINQTHIDFTCVSGTCVDDNSTDVFDTTASLGAVYSVSDNLSFFANIAQSYDPYTAERIDENGDALDSETSLQYEAGFKYGIQQDLNLTVSAYQINKDNVAQSLGGGVYETIGKVESKGAEVDLQWTPSENWQIKAGYAYNETVATEGENAGLTLAHAPENSAYLFTRYDLPKPVLGGTLGFSFGASYRDEVKTDISFDDSVTLPGYTVADIGMYFEQKDWSASLNIGNIFDKTYYYAGSDNERIYPGDPRSVAFTVTRNF